MPARTKMVPSQTVAQPTDPPKRVQARQMDADLPAVPDILGLSTTYWAFFPPQRLVAYKWPGTTPVQGTSVFSIAIAADDDWQGRITQSSGNLGMTLVSHSQNDRQRRDGPTPLPSCRQLGERGAPPSSATSITWSCSWTDALAMPISSLLSVTAYCDYLETTNFLIHADSTSGNTKVLVRSLSCF